MRVELKIKETIVALGVGILKFYILLLMVPFSLFGAWDENEIVIRLR